MIHSLPVTGSFPAIQTFTVINIPCCGQYLITSLAIIINKCGFDECSFITTTTTIIMMMTMMMIIISDTKYMFFLSSIEKIFSLLESKQTQSLFL